MLLNIATSPVDERLRQTERIIAYIRAAVVVFNSATYLVASPGGGHPGVAYVLVAVSLLYSLLTLGWRPAAGSPATFAGAVATTIADNVLIAVWIWATGGFGSPYYPLFYAEAAATVGRFGLRIGTLSAIGGAVLYAGVVLVDGGVDAYRLAVRLGYVFIISSFVAYVVEAGRRSERRIAEAQAAAESYRELDRLKSGFVARVSHELRTPLTAIRGAATTLTRNHTRFEADEQHTLLAMIDRQAGHLGRLVEDLIDVALLDQQKLSATLRGTDIVELVRVEVGLVSEWATQELVVDSGVPELVVECDPAKVARALRNVLENATKFSPEESAVTVQVDQDVENAYITVTDEGAGIPAEEHDRIFDRFYQVDESLTRKVYGAGLGLNLAQGLMRLHGGDIRVVSSLGRGSRFTLVLPKEPMTEPVATGLRFA